MKIYFIRHGESDYNLAQRHSGWTQVELTEQGKAQAESLRTYLSKISFDKLYVSDLKRAIQTSQLAIPGSNAEQTPLLREYSTGKLAGNDLVPADFRKLRQHAALAFGIGGGGAENAPAGKG